MIALLTTIFEWFPPSVWQGTALGVGFSIFDKILDKLKNKFWPVEQKVIIDPHTCEPKKVARRADVYFAYFIIFVMIVFFIVYVHFTNLQIPFLNHKEVVQEYEKIKMFSIGIVIILFVKLMGYNTTFKTIAESLPLVKNFIKK
jgi:hypothetical protein